MDAESGNHQPPDWLILEIDIALLEIREPDLRAHALGRIITQYIPAVLKASDQTATERAYHALFRYLIAKPTKRKPWVLAEAHADLAVNEIKKIVEKLIWNLRSGS